MVSIASVVRDTCEEKSDIIAGCSLRLLTSLAKSWEFLMWYGVSPTMGARMEAKYMEMFYVTELMLLTVGLRGSSLLMDLQSTNARDGF